MNKSCCLPRYLMHSHMISYDDEKHLNGKLYKGVIKRFIDKNLETICNNPNTYNVKKNTDAYSYLADNFSLFPSPDNLMNECMLRFGDYHFAHYNTFHNIVENDNIIDTIIYNVWILIFEITQPHSITLSVVNDDKWFSNLIYRHIKMINNATSTEDIYSNEIHKEFIEHIEKLHILDLSFKQPSSIKTPMFPYQLDNLSWMIQLEKQPIKIRLYTSGIIQQIVPDIYISTSSIIPFKKLDIPVYEFKGGIIADEVGCGKTIQIIALITLTPNIKTLVVVPDHVVHHWHSEIIKHISSDVDINIFHVMSFTEFSNLTRDTISDFERIVIDEIQETYCENNKHYSKILFNANNLCFKYKWGLTGTPIINTNSLACIMQYLLDNQCYISYPWIIRTQNIRDKLSCVFRRSLKRTFLHLPPVSIYNIHLKFNKIEQDIYNAELSAKTCIDIDFLRKLCCDVFLSIGCDTTENMTVDELKHHVLDYFTHGYTNILQQIDDLNSKKNNLLDCIDVLKKNTDSDNSITTHTKSKLIHEYTDLIHQYDTNIQSLHTNALSKKASLDRYTTIINQVDGVVNSKQINDINDAHCSICLSDATDMADIISIIDPCFHYFCYSCISEYMKLNSNPTCPYCRIPFTSSNIKTVQKSVTKCSSGTKIDYIVKAIKATNKRFLLFTQFNNLIKYISKNLINNNIKCTTYDVYKLMSQSDKDDISVLILSSSTNASGIDLIEFSNVIIFEPFEDYVLGREIEKQIIGRVYRIGQTSNISVYRLIIQNTIEEKIYNGEGITEIHNIDNN